MGSFTIAIVFSTISTLFLVIVLAYMYKTSRLKYCKYFAASIFCYAIGYLFELKDFGFMHLKSVQILSNIISLFGIMLLAIGIYYFTKNEIPKVFKIIAGIILILITMVSFNILTIIEQETLLHFIVGIFMIWISVLSFYHFEFAKIGKYITVISSFIFGIVYLIFSLDKNLIDNSVIWYVIDPILYLFIGVGIIISYYERTKNELLISDRRYKLALEGSNDGIWEYDLINDKAYISERSMRFLGIENREETTRREIWDSHIHPDDIENLNRKNEEFLRGETEYYNCEYRIKNKSGEYRWISARGKALFDDKGKPLKLAGSHTDITERKKSEEKIHYLAYYDEVTGLPNKASFMDRLDEILEVNIKDNKKGAVFIIDIDNFRHVNDSLGYFYGDKNLKEVGERIKSCIYQNSMLARSNEDQFMVIIENYDYIGEIRGIAELLLKSFHDQFTIKNFEFHLTISIGITVFPDQGTSSQVILKDAELAMYKAKELGKNRYEFFEKSMNDEIMNKLIMEKLLNDAVENEEFKVYYQLQKDLKTNKFTGAEALVRWIHPEKGFISPAEFIPLAEETSLIIPIGEFVLRSACKKNKELHENGHNNFTISVNVSIIQLNKSDFVSLVKEILEETKLEPKYLTLEITESILMQSLESNIKKLEELRELGVNIALDDFGTGYSSFSYLLKLPIDILKIDKSFVDDIVGNVKEESIIGSMISIAKTIKLDVVAEGVETIEQLDILNKQECDKIQGYIFSKPTPEEEVEKHLV